jgi:hypothetical protein
MGLGELVDYALVATIGNRITAGATILSLNTFATYQIFGSLVGLLALTPLCVAFPLFGVTLAGTSTLEYYHRSVKHIKRFERLDHRFATTLIKGGENDAIFGYCELQGMYLAARNYGQLDAFYKAKKEVSNNIIPNF